MDIVKDIIMECGSYDTRGKTQNGQSGRDGTNRQTGGGGSGYAHASGAYGSSESGSITSSTRVHNVYAYGGAGGRGTSYSGGNPGTSVRARPNINIINYTVRGASGSNLGGTGGGLLIIYANSILNNNKILSNGIQKQNGTGGGSINIFYKDKIVEGTMQATRGNADAFGGIGGNGTVTIQNIGEN